MRIIVCIIVFLSESLYAFCQLGSSGDHRAHLGSTEGHLGGIWVSSGSSWNHLGVIWVILVIWDIPMYICNLSSELQNRMNSCGTLATGPKNHVNSYAIEAQGHKSTWHGIVWNTMACHAMPWHGIAYHSIAMQRTACQASHRFAQLGIKQHSAAWHSTAHTQHSTSQHRTA